LADQYSREYLCGLNILILPTFDLLCDLIMNDLGPSSNKVNLLISFFLRVDTRVSQKVSVQFASDVIHSHSLLREIALVLA
jgi:hypothetical protein